MFNKILFLFAIFLTVGFLFDSSFAEQKIEVSIPRGTATPGCEENDLCYIPSPITVNVGDVVQWINIDSAVHTVTSGSPKDGPDGIIYSDLINPDEEFVFRFDEPGSYPYFCMVHPWMQGLVIAQISEEAIQSPTSVFELTEQRITADGSTIITIHTDNPEAGNTLQIELEFTNDESQLLVHMNYDIRVVQDREEVLMLENAHAMAGSAEHHTRVLESDNPIDIEIGIRGIYPDDESPQDVEEIIEFQEIPEFGTIAIFVLVASILALIAMRVKLPRILDLELYHNPSLRDYVM